MLQNVCATPWKLFQIFHQIGKLVDDSTLDRSSVCFTLCFSRLVFGVHPTGKGQNFSYAANLA